MGWVTGLVLGSLALLVVIVIVKGRGAGAPGHDAHGVYPGDGGGGD